MESQNMEKSKVSLAKLSSLTDELIAAVRRQQTNFSAKLNEQKEKNEALEKQNSLLTAQIQTITAEKEKLLSDLTAAQNNKESEAKISELQNIIEAKNTKISGLQTEVQNLNTALSNRKNQIEQLEQNNTLLNSQKDELRQKVEELETASLTSGSAVESVQLQLDAVLKEKEELTQKYQQSEQLRADMKETISQTTDSIDDVVARLEKVLEENGAGNSNN